MESILQIDTGSHNAPTPIGGRPRTANSFPVTESPSPRDPLIFGRFRTPCMIGGALGTHPVVRRVSGAGRQETPTVWTAGGTVSEQC